MGKGQPYLPDIATEILAGIDPTTKLPNRLMPKGQKDITLKINARRLFRIIDEQRAVNRYTWYNLPAGISSQELERLLYYRYSLIFFYYKDLNQFFFMPYTLNGSLDFYGRYNSVSPVPIAEESAYEKTKEYQTRKAILSKIKLDVVKDVVVLANEITEEKLTNSAVILRDYTNQLGQLSEARYNLNDHLLDLEADCLPFMRTNLLIGTGIQGLRVPDADSASEVDTFARQMYDSALVGNPYTAIIGKVEFQELQPASTLKASEFFLAMQSIDNILLSTYGIENTGVYEKKAHILESENAVNASNASLVMQDGLSQRQNFCNIVNSLWNLGMWCELSETVSQADINGDGVLYDEATDGAGSGHSVEDEGGDE